MGPGIAQSIATYLCCADADEGKVKKKMNKPQHFFFFCIIWLVPSLQVNQCWKADNQWL